MSDINPDAQANVICHCSGTTTQKIMDLIDAGFDNMDELSRKTGACSGCGACEYSVIALIAEHGWLFSESHPCRCSLKGARLCPHKSATYGC